MSIKLNVPKVAQAREMDCWYAGACMVNYYFEAGPRLGLPKVWAENKGLTDWAALARAEGLAEVGSQDRLWNETNLGQILRDFGPIWCAGDWYGFGHVVVLTGVTGDLVYINDPDGGVEKSQTHAWFNTHLYKSYSYAMLRRKA
jgi:hypothetical protein